MDGNSHNSSRSSATKPFTAIAAMSLNRVIGAGGKIPWHLPEDLQWFKRMTTGHVIVLGRKTFQAMGRPLPNRQTIVLSRSQFSSPGVRSIGSLDELLKLAGVHRVFICGGAEVYRQTLPFCSDLYLTIVKRIVVGDVFFPPFEDEFEFVETLLDQPDFKILHYKNRVLGLSLP